MDSHGYHTHEHPRVCSPGKEVCAGLSVPGQVDPGSLGQRAGLSEGDLLATDHIYDVCWDDLPSQDSFWQANPWSACSASCYAPGRDREVFCHDPDMAWQGVMARMGGPLSVYASMPGDLSLN